MPLVKERRTLSTLRDAAIGTYAAAVIVFGVGLTGDFDRLRDVGLAVGIVGIAVDMRHYTARGINRVVHAMTLWQDGEPPAADPPTHRAPYPRQASEPVEP